MGSIESCKLQGPYSILEASLTPRGLWDSLTPHWVALNELYSEQKTVVVVVVVVVLLLPTLSTLLPTLSIPPLLLPLPTLSNCFSLRRHEERTQQTPKPAAGTVLVIGVQNLLHG